MTRDDEYRPGLSGRLARRFQDNPLTPVLALVGLLLGVVAALFTPREEEPQIDVTLANVIVPFAGADARQVAQLLSEPLEQRLARMAQVEHTWSLSRPGMAVVTVQFEVGVTRDTALLRLYDAVYSDRAPAIAGIGEAVIQPRGVDDVPVMTLTLWSDDAAHGPLALAEVAGMLQTELKRISGTRDIALIGAPQRVVQVTLDPARLAGHGLVAADLRDALRAANVAQQAGDRIGAQGAAQFVAGRFLADRDDVAALVLGLHDGRPVRIEDVAHVDDGADVATRYVWHGAVSAKDGPQAGTAPAVTLTITKQPGSNASDITRAVRARIAALQGVLIPDHVRVEVTRDYGRTAADKARTLIGKLGFATATVVLLVLAALGRREALVIGTAVVLTLAVTLFASMAMGFTLNRVSLFALIFSIGILVDDAIVVVENIHRRRHDGGLSLREAIPRAVDEVGGPTILATFTVIAALMPMAFVGGLMGPYMRPIPINASVGMLLSLAIALVVTPWLALKLLARHQPAAAAAADIAPSRLQRIAERLLRPFLHTQRGVPRRRALAIGIGIAVMLAIGLALSGAVVLKMLPFDNKSELQVVVDLPEGRTLEDTAAVLGELAAQIARVPEVRDYQAYAGTSAPINFNGLVRQYALRRDAHQGDLQVNLVGREARHRSSHEIAQALRAPLAAIGRRHAASVKVIEVPPGPPVRSPIVAEVYGPDPQRVRAIAVALEQRLLATDGIVDVDSSIEHESVRERFEVDRVRAARLGVPVPAVVDALATAVGGLDATWILDGASRQPHPVRLRLAPADQADAARLLALQVRGNDGRRVALSELVRPLREPHDAAIHHKDLQPVAYVTADEGGTSDSPLYGMFGLVRAIAQQPPAGEPVLQHFFSSPQRPDRYAIAWDGEWTITWETFRDMGIAYAAGLVLIYLLVVAWFRSYAVPLVIMVPIPLTVIGVMPGHALLGAQFTATSMIGMIALAGIIVRNSILLVDVIDQLRAEGVTLADAVVQACAMRAAPIGLTAIAAMAGALFILDDPIFNGLAITLVSGILVSTLLTLLVIPLLYYVLLQRRAHAHAG